MDQVLATNTAEKTVDYRQTLKRAFVQRREKNPSYSLRSFARDLDVSASMLSDVMNRKKCLTRKSATKMSRFLRLSKSDAELFFLSIDLEHSSSLQTASDVQAKIDERTSIGQVFILKDDLFRTIADYRHYVVLALFGVKNFRYNLTWIAGMVGGFQSQMKELYKRLEKVGVVKFDSNSEPILMKDAVFADDNVPSEAIRTYHRATLHRALDSISTIPMGERDYRSYIFAIDQEDFIHIQKDIRDFHDRLYAKYGRKPTANRVYGVQSQVIPYSNRSDL